MDKQMLQAIRDWLAESNALDEMACIPTTLEDYKERVHKWDRARTLDTETWIRALLDEHDTREAGDARIHEIFGREDE